LQENNGVLLVDGKFSGINMSKSRVHVQQIMMLNKLQVRATYLLHLYRLRVTLLCKASLYIAHCLLLVTCCLHALRLCIHTLMLSQQQDIDERFFERSYYYMLFDSSFISLNQIVDHTPANMRRQVMNEIMAVDKSSDEFRLRSQTLTSLDTSYGVLSTQASRALVVASRQTDANKIETYCTTDTDTDSATSSDDSSDHHVNYTVTGMRDDQLPHTATTATAAPISTVQTSAVTQNLLNMNDTSTSDSGEISSESIDFGIAGIDNISGLGLERFSQSKINRLVSVNVFFSTVSNCTSLCVLIRCLLSVAHLVLSRACSCMYSHACHSYACAYRTTATNCLICLYIRATLCLCVTNMQRREAVQCNNIDRMLYYLCHPHASLKVYHQEQWLRYKHANMHVVDTILSRPLPGWLLGASEQLQAIRQIAVSKQTATQATASTVRLSSSARATASVQAGAAAKAIAAAQSSAASIPLCNNNSNNSNNNTTNNRRYSGGSTRYSSNTTYSSAYDTKYSNSSKGVYNNKFENGNSSSYGNTGATFI
jgi:hypothetical protein